MLTAIVDGCRSYRGSCVLKASVDRVSVDTIGQYIDRQSADISKDTLQICWLRLNRVLLDMFLKLIDCWSTLSAGMSVDTWPTPQLICFDRQSQVYRSTVGGVSVETLSKYKVKTLFCM